jgi:hypothetical protein
MANKRLSMRKIHDVLRLAFETGLGIRAIARCVNASPATVGDYLRRAEAAGLGWVRLALADVVRRYSPGRMPLPASPAQG